MSRKPASGKRSVILDPIHPRDYRELTIIYACEQCSHFDPHSQSCTIGYDATLHLKAHQDRTYELYGRVAFCRFSEID
ncbi:MAG: hypothetical protein AB7G93_18635 [Bdellovibrionales bacterium]